MNASGALLADLRDGKELSAADQRRLILSLSWPAILAQISVTIMQLIDAGMAGRLGVNASAAIGLVASSTWLINGICSGAVYGFSVQTAQALGARENALARSLCRMGLVICLGFGLAIGALGAALSGWIPAWMQADEAIAADASAYLCVFCLSLPFVLLNSWAVQMLQATGDTKLPGLAQVVMCFLDVAFNYLFTFVFGLGVLGLALGTAAAEVCCSLLLTVQTLCKNPALGGSMRFHWKKACLKRALKIGAPISAEQLISGSSYVMFTRIVSSLGPLSIAANSFAITAESLCYMPGYGCGSAATAIVGQCTGAGREQLNHEISNRILRIGVLMMSAAGVVMFVCAPLLMAILTPDLQVQALGVKMLRMEAFAEPMYGLSIVATAILRGKGDTFWPAVLSFATIWCIRIPLAAAFVSPLGLTGAWLAMNIELNCRGLLFWLRLHFSWKKSVDKAAASF